MKTPIFSNGNSGLAAEIGLALAKKCGLDRPQRVVLSIERGRIGVCANVWEPSTYPDRNNYVERKFSLVGDAAKEMLRLFFPDRYEEDNIDKLEIAIEANAVTVCRIEQAMREDDETLVGFHEMCQNLDQFEVEPFNEG